MFALLFVLFGMLAHGEEVDAILVVVEAELITLSEVELEGELTTLSENPHRFWTSGTARQRVVDAAVLRHLAADLPIYAPTPEAVRDQREALREQVSGRNDWVDFLERWGLDEVALDRLIRKRMVAERVLDRNVVVDPTTDGASWDAATTLLLARARERVRVRWVE